MNTRKSFKNDSLWKNSDQKVFLLDQETLVTQQNHLTVFYSMEGERIAEKKNSGVRNVSDMILLSNGSMMYSTIGIEPCICVIKKDGTISFSEPTRNKIIDSIKELVDGSVAVRFSTSILIMKPCFKELDNINYKIDQLQLQLRYDSTKLTLYQELADLYKEKGEPTYQIYLSGLEAAAKCHHLYQARRFYEKARKLQPQNEEPIQSFLLFYLKNSPHEKLKKQISLDLFNLTENEEYIRPLKDKKYKKMLLVGEGDFSFTEAFLLKHKKSHPGIGQSITATELLAPADQAVIERFVSLRKQGVEILCGVDAQSIHRFFKGRRFERIQWNCPFGGKADDISKQVFSKVLPAFFQSCSLLQLAGDRIHITLVQEKDGYWKKRQKENPIVLASFSSNYRLIRKRRFETDRYLQYHHVKTGKTESYEGGVRKREFVFEKLAEEMPKPSCSDQAIALNNPEKHAEEMPKPSFSDQALALKDPAQKEYKISTDKKDNPLPEDYYFECSTDEDSSDGYESD
jgi:hypothetical protein